MSPAKERNDWNPEAYARFRGLRLRPALDLLAQIPEIPEAGVVDLGCGTGSVGLSLKKRFGDRVCGVDSSPAMLEKAQQTGAYINLVEADIARWRPNSPPALIYSNAALHWLDGHDTLMPKLARMLVPGGILAVQMPRQFGAPSHRFLRDIAQSMFPDRFDYTGWQAPVGPATIYWQMLAPLGQVDAWEIDYVQHLAPSSEGHPVRRFTESTAMRPFVEKLSSTEADEFIRRYEAALGSAYPLLPDGGVVFPIRRMFFTLKV